MTDFSEPKVSSLGNIFKFWFPDERVNVFLDRISDNGSGVHGEITVTTDRQGYDPFIHYSTINLSSIRNRKEIANYANSRLNLPDWNGMLQAIATQVVTDYRSGLPATDVGTKPFRNPNTFKLWPIVLQNEQNMMYGLGGSGKSYIGCLVALLIQSGESRCGLKAQKGNVLYLDYETSDAEVNDRVRLLKEGLNIEKNCSFKYRTCFIPLADDVEAIKRLVIENSIDTVIVDSVGPACGGEPESAEIALKYFRAVRSLNVTSLHITHKTKDSQAKGPFGSVYWWNTMRNIWAVRHSQDFNSQTIHIGLYHEKINSGNLLYPLGLELAFYEGGITLDKKDVGDSPILSSALPVREQIHSLLKEMGSMTIKEIASELDMQESAVKTSLYRNKGKLFIQIAKKWGAISNNE